MRRRNFLGTAGLLLGSGCLRLSTEGNDGTPRDTPITTANPESPTRTSTPRKTNSTASSPTEEPTEDSTATASPDDAISMPIGVTSEGISKRVADGHTSELAGKSFQMSFIEENLVEGETNIDTTTKYDSRTVLRQFHGKRGDKYSRESETTWRKRANDEYTYGNRPVQTIDLHQASRNEALREYIQAGDFDSVNRVEQDGQVFYRGTASKPATGAAEAFHRFDPDEVTAFSGETLIRPSGVVEKLSATVEFVRGDRVSKVRTDLGTSNIGSVSLSEPAWVPEAREQAPEFEAELLDDRRFLRFDHLSGVPLPAHTQIDIHGSSEAVKNHIENETPITAGERFWLWRDEEDAYLKRGSKPSVSPKQLDADGWIELQYRIGTFYKARFHEL